MSRNTRNQPHSSSVDWSSECEPHDVNSLDNRHVSFARPYGKQSRASGRHGRKCSTRGQLGTHWELGMSGSIFRLTTRPFLPPLAPFRNTSTGGGESGSSCAALVSLFLSSCEPRCKAITEAQLAVWAAILSCYVELVHAEAMFKIMDQSLRFLFNPSYFCQCDLGSFEP